MYFDRFIFASEKQNVWSLSDGEVVDSDWHRIHIAHINN